MVVTLEEKGSGGTNNVHFIDSYLSIYIKLGVLLCFSYFLFLLFFKSAYKIMVYNKPFYTYMPLYLLLLTFLCDMYLRVKNS